MGTNTIDINSMGASQEDRKATPKDYMKSLVYGGTFSIVVGIVLALAVWYFESICDIIAFLTMMISAFIPRAFLRKAHQWQTMIICALVAFANPFAMYLTMETLGIEFEDTFWMTLVMILAPFAGLYAGYIKTKDPSLEGAPTKS